MKLADELERGPSTLPRYSRAPAWLDDGSSPHHFPSPLEYFRQIYYQTCDLLQRELQDRFDQNYFLPPALNLEKALVKAANGEAFDNILKLIESSCFKDDLDSVALKHHLPLLLDVVKQFNPHITKVTKVVMQ